LPAEYIFNDLESVFIEEGFAVETHILKRWNNFKPPFAPMMKIKAEKSKLRIGSMKKARSLKRKKLPKSKMT